MSDIEEFHIKLDKQITITYIIIHETSLITGEAKAESFHTMKLAAPWTRLQPHGSW
jgi:hypothetical protein